MRAARPKTFFVPLFALALLLGIGPLGSASSAAHEPPTDPQEPPPELPGIRDLGPLDPGFQTPPSAQRFDGVGPFQHLPAQDESPFVVIAVRHAPYWKAGTPDPVLTDACRLGDFASLPLNRMVVRFDSPQGPGALQVILPDRRNLLVDTRGLALPKETYYFLDSSYPTCLVWVENPAKKRRLNAQGNSLPPADPNALKKREAQIKSWPQQ